MGMFDYIEQATDCEVCGKPLAATLVPTKERTVAFFRNEHTTLFCEVCGTKHDFYVDKSNKNTIEVKIEPYAKAESLGE